MKTIKSYSVCKFRTHAHRLLENVFRTGYEILIRKHNQPLAIVVPFRPKRVVCKPDRLARFLICEKDILTPITEYDRKVCG